MSETIFAEDSKGEQNATSTEERGQEARSVEGTEQETRSETSGEGITDSSDQTSTDNAAEASEAEEVETEEKAATEEGEVDEDSEESEYEFELPENSYLSDDYLQELAEFAETNGLSKDQAQELALRESGVIEDVFEVALQSYREEGERELQEASERWVEELKNDPDVGGDKAAQTAELYKRFTEAYFPENLRNWLAESGLGNNFSLVKAIRAAAIDLGMGDDAFERGGNITRSEKRSDAELFYGKQTD